MNTEQYSKHIIPRLKQVSKKIQLLKSDIITDREQGKLKNISEYYFQNCKAESMFSDIIQDIAWCHDQILSIRRVFHDPYNPPKTKEDRKAANEYHKGWIYKMRKALGYTYS